MPDDATLLLTLLGEQVQYVLDQPKERRLIALPRLLAFLQREPRIATLVADLEEEAREALIDLGREAARVHERLGLLWVAHGADIRSLLAGARDEALSAYGGGMDGYDERLKSDCTPSFTSDSRWPSTDHVQALGHWTKYATQVGGLVPAGVEDALNQTEKLVETQKYLERAFRIVAGHMGGAALERLRDVSSRLNPAPPSDEGDEMARLARTVAFMRSDDFASLVFSPHLAESGHLRRDDVDAEIAAVAVDVRLVHEELRQLILVGQSRRALVRRYAARCEGFDAPRLRKVATGGAPEAQLTLDFARYLFDQGLNPLIEPMVSKLRPDVFEPLGQNAFYVEAKQYAHPHPRARLRAAFNQVWSTWERLRKPFHVPEAFLLVFRRDGPLVVLPPKLRHGELRLYPILVDISPHGGSREKRQPVLLTEEELLPSEGDSKKPAK